MASLTDFQEVERGLYNPNNLCTECVCQFILEGIAAKGYILQKLMLIEVCSLQMSHQPFKKDTNAVS